MSKYLLSWRLRVAGTSQENHEDGQLLLETFAKWQPAPDQNFLQFLNRIDGQGGFAVVETENPAGLFAEIAKFTPWQEFDLIPVMDIMDSVPMAVAAAQFRSSL